MQIYYFCSRILGWQSITLQIQSLTDNQKTNVSHQFKYRTSAYRPYPIDFHWNSIGRHGALFDEPALWLC